MLILEYLHFGKVSLWRVHFYAKCSRIYKFNLNHISIFHLQAKLRKRPRKGALRNTKEMLKVEYLRFQQKENIQQMVQQKIRSTNRKGNSGEFGTFCQNMMRVGDIY